MGATTTKEECTPVLVHVEAVVSLAALVIVRVAFLG